MRTETTASSQTAVTDGDIIGSYNDRIAAMAPRLSQLLYNSRLRGKNKREAKIYLQIPEAVPYSAANLTQLPGYVALVAAAAKLDRALKVTATEEDVAGERAYVVRVTH